MQWTVLSIHQMYVSNKDCHSRKKFCWTLQVVIFNTAVLIQTAHLLCSTSFQFGDILVQSYPINCLKL